MIEYEFELAFHPEKPDKSAQQSQRQGIPYLIDDNRAVFVILESVRVMPEAIGAPQCNIN